jgi:hypothetical protein
MYETGQILTGLLQERVHGLPGCRKPVSLLRKEVPAGQINLEEYRSEPLRLGVHDRDGNL